MKRFIEGEDRSQSTLFPEHLDDYEDNPVRVIDVFVDELDLNGLGFEGMQRRGRGPLRAGRENHVDLGGSTPCDLEHPSIFRSS